MSTRLRWCGERRRVHTIEPVNAVRDLGVFIDSDLGAATHVRKTVSRCFAAIRQLRHLRRYVTMTVSVLLWCPLSILGWTMATSYLSVFLPIFNDASRPFLTPQLVWCFDFVATTTWPMSMRYYTGYVSQNGWVSNLRGWHNKLSCSAWHDAGVFESTRSVIRPARSSPSPVVIYTRAVRSVISSDNHWPWLVSCCSRSLEHFACSCPVIAIYCNLSPATLVPTVISGHHHLTLVTMLRRTS